MDIIQASYRPQLAAETINPSLLPRCYSSSVQDPLATRCVVAHVLVDTLSNASLQPIRSCTKSASSPQKACAKHRLQEDAVFQSGMHLVCSRFSRVCGISKVRCARFTAPANIVHVQAISLSAVSVSCPVSLIGSPPWLSFWLDRCGCPSWRTHPQTLRIHAAQPQAHWECHPFSPGAGKKGGRCEAFHIRNSIFPHRRSKPPQTSSIRPALERASTSHSEGPCFKSMIFRI